MQDWAAERGECNRKPRGTNKGIRGSGLEASGFIPRVVIVIHSFIHTVDLRFFRCVSFYSSLSWCTTLWYWYWDLRQMRHVGRSLQGQNQRPLWLWMNNGAKVLGFTQCLHRNWRGADSPQLLKQCSTGCTDFINFRKTNEHDHGLQAFMVYDASQ